MDLAALGFWIATAIGGLYMLGVTMRSGNQSSEAVDSHFPAWVPFTHGFLALSGLGVWTLFMGYGDQTLAWGSLGVLIVVGLLGGFMLHRWKKDQRGTPEEVAERRERLAEQQIPSSAVAMHGLMALGTVLFVVLSALFVADSS
jgi:hypothetical protein